MMFSVGQCIALFGGKGKTDIRLMNGCWKGIDDCFKTIAFVGGMLIDKCHD